MRSILLPRHGFMKRVLLLIPLAITLISCSHEVKVLDSHKFIASGNSSVFEQTRERFKIEYDSLDLGVFITSIEGEKQGKTTYWLYEVNSQPINIASDKYFPNPGDTVQWKLASVY
jgi:hypothetical protein